MSSLEFSASKKALLWPPLLAGNLIRRYRRFMADVRLTSGETVTAHCPNTGSMIGCSEPGRKVYLSYHDDPKRKLKYSWQLIEMPDSLVGINTSVPNRLVAESIRAGRIPPLKDYDKVRSEVKAGKNSRIDLLLEKENTAPCYVEIKNCTLVENGAASFPDAVTSRGLKHLKELQALVRAGNRAAMFYLIQRMDAVRFKAADQIDPDYARELKSARRNGVEVMAFDVAIDMKSIRIRKQVPFQED